jgi:hypothetical protein
MKYLSLAALIAACAAAAPAFAADTVSEIDVVVDIDAVQNPQAARYWGQLETDLEGAILSRLTDQIAEDGAKITVDVDELELANAFEEARDIADTRLLATVKQSSETDNSRIMAYDLAVDVNSAMVFLPAGSTLTALTFDTPELYTALVDAFAEEVVKRIR